jgi:hypothetical protein
VLISCGVEEVGACGGEEAVKELADTLDQGVDGARWFLSQECLEL